MGARRRDADEAAREGGASFSPPQDQIRGVVHEGRGKRSRRAKGPADVKVQEDLVPRSGGIGYQAG